MDIAAQKYLIGIQWGKGMFHPCVTVNFSRTEAIEYARILKHHYARKHKRGNVPTILVMERVAIFRVEPLPNKPKRIRNKSIPICINRKGVIKK